MIVEKILKQATPERAKKEIEKIKKIILPDSIQKWVDEYEKVGKLYGYTRNGYIWKWLYQMFPLVELSSTFDKNKKSLLEIKILLTILVVQIDDIADMTENKKNKILLKELFKIPFNDNKINYNNLNTKDKEYSEFTQKLWKYISQEIKKYPNYKNLKRMFDYDMKQVVNAMEYSFLVNQNHYLINPSEYWLYPPHNMTFMLYLMLDLMCSPLICLEKIGLLRDATWESQKMGRITNWITTWEREIEDDDFSSAVFAYALDNGTIKYEEIKKPDKEKIKSKIKKANIEQELLNEWEKSYYRIKKMQSKIKPVKINSFLDGQSYLLLVDLSSKGYK